MTLVKELKVPEVTTIQRIAFGILCSLKFYNKKSYVSWAENWLSGKDRSYEKAAAHFPAIINASVGATWVDQLTSYVCRDIARATTETDAAAKATAYAARAAAVIVNTNTAICNSITAIAI